MLPGVRAVGGGQFRYVDKLEVASVARLTPLAARHLVESFGPDVEVAWAMISSRDQARIAYGPPENWPPGGVFDAEARLHGQISLRLRSVDDGSLTLWAYGSALGSFVHKQDIWTDRRSLSGLIAHTRTFLGSRKNSTITYDVYWQLADGFGLRERLALLAGMEGFSDE
jgi:hypothetical protein